jgi:two-component system response regulator HydG
MTLSSTQILIVDDEETICEAFAAWFIKDGYQVETAASGLEALEKIAQKHFDIYLVDIKMPGMDGIELLGRLKESQPDAAVIMITAHGSIQTAVEAMKKGASDYLCKPFDPDELSLLMERVMASKALRDENLALREQLLDRQEAILDVFVIHSEAMQKVFATIQEIGPSQAPVLITGETGVGKDLVARAIHIQSERSFGPFVAVNCGAMSESLLESELFGHERGAFTGAVKARRGRLEMANNGTLFLDEIGEISWKMQVSLLRALEEKSFQRLGGSQTIKTDFRLISATHRDLATLIKEGRFREDFFYRINVIEIHIPPLRERLEDVPALADHFLKRYVEETGKYLEGFTQRALGILTAYAWPGNIRELRNVIERAVVIAQGRMIGASELTFLCPPQDEYPMGPITLKEVEIGHIKATLAACNGNVSKAAKQLGIDRSTLTRKIKRHCIEQA